MNDYRPTRFAEAFYPSHAEALKLNIEQCYEKAKTYTDQEKVEALVSLCPHAGYVYSGEIVASLLSKVQLKNKLVILCPNHTGMGKNLAVWPSGAWETPLGDAKIDSELAEKIITSSSYFQDSKEAHINEHSIEVLLPFLLDYFARHGQDLGQDVGQDFSFVPICVREANLEEAALVLANIYKAQPDFDILISSDLNHFANEEITNHKDKLAINAFLDMEPKGFLDCIRRNHISMCGAYAANLALNFLQNLNPDLQNNCQDNFRANFIAHTTSAKVNLDTSRVVGYASAYISRLSPES